MFYELLEAASFIALFVGIRMLMLQLNAQAFVQPLALLAIFSANLFLRGEIFAPLGLRLEGLGAGLWRWKAEIGVAFVLLPLTLFLVLRVVWPPFVVYLAEYLGKLRSLDIRSFAPFTLAATFMEEAIARGYLQSRFHAALGPWAGILAASVFFAWLHWTPGPDRRPALTHVALGFGASVLLGWMFASTGNLFVPWIAHAAWDLTLLCLLFLLGPRPADVSRASSRNPS